MKRKLNILFRALNGCCLRIKAWFDIRLRKTICRTEATYVPDLVVSLTSYGAGVKRCAPYAVYSVLKQDVRPYKVILWLDETKWSMNNVPKLMKRLIRSGLEIRFCHDVKSHTKLLPALKAYPDKVIVTVDDDLYYSRNFLTTLYEAYQTDKKSIHALKVQYPTYGPDGILEPHRKWMLSYMIRDNFPYDARKIMALGYGGVLYPAGAFDEEVFNEKVFMRLCPYADDIWFFAMALKKGTLRKYVLGKNVSYYAVDFFYQYFHTSALHDINIVQDRNSSQMTDVLRYYGLTV